MSKKILVTGADGFIGSHLVEELVESGYEVKALVQYNSFDSRGWLDNIASEVTDNIEIVSGDIRDPNGISSVMKGCDAVMHLAALIAIPFSYNSPDSYVDTNVKGTLNVLQAAKRLGLEKVVHTSTSEVYGTAQFVPITEEHPLVGQSPYSATKIAADQLAYSFYSSFDTPLVIVRPFNTFGPRQSNRAVIPTIITQVAAGADTIKLGNLSATRDFMYVKDTVQGFLSALRSDVVDGRVVNIGTGHEISIEKTAKLIAGLMRRQITILSDEVRMRPQNSEVERLVADNSRALRELNWKPRYCGEEGFVEALKETIKWFSHIENIDKYQSHRYTI